MTVKEIIEAIQKIDIEINKQDMGSMERVLQQRNRAFLINKCFEQGGLTALLNANLLLQ